jgi:hypothetical protein
MSRYDYLKKKDKKGFVTKLTSTQKRFLMVVVIAVILFSIQLVIYLKK